MDFRHRLRRLFSFGARQGGVARRSRALKRRMFLEPLESRQLLASFNFNDDDDSFPSFPGNYAPPVRSQSGTAAFLTTSTAGDPLTVARNYLQQNAGALGLTSDDISRASVVNVYTESSGLAHVYLQQMFNGLPVADAIANVNLMTDGRVITAWSNFVSGLTYPASNTALSPSITAAAAINAVVAGSGGPSGGTLTETSPPIGRNQSSSFENSAISTTAIPAKLVYVPVAGGGVELAWEVALQPPGEAHSYVAAVGAGGARSGQLVRVHDLVRNASYNVLPRTPVPVQDPLFGAPATVVNPDDPPTSPFGWHDTNGFPGADVIDTSGNNVQAQEDIDSNNTGGTRPTSLSLDFNPAPIDFTQPPPFNQNAAIVNAYYWLNVAHDVTARHGYTEASGNSQVFNYSGLGLSNDPVIVDVSDPIADISTTAFNGPFIQIAAEGQSPRISMGTFFIDPFTGTPLSVPRDASFDATILSHEYFHNVVNRLTGGSQSVLDVIALQSRGMDEGWADWFGLVMTAKATDFPATSRTTGNWVLGQTSNGIGVRRQPYSFDFSIDPLTLANYNGDTFPEENNTEVHNSGEIWASALWDMTQLLIGKYGFTTDLSGGFGGNTKALDLVIAGLKLQPANPTFMQARDGIVAADLALNGGANYELIWQAFARRGIGFSSSTSDSDSTIVFPAFDVPPAPARVSGLVFNDVDGDTRRDLGEPVLAGITVYSDSNNNNRLDAGETQTQTGSDGRYNLVFLSAQTVTLRQSLPPAFVQTFPVNNGAHVFFVFAGQSVGNKDFGNQSARGRIAGLKYNDLNGNGSYDTGEPGIRNVFIFADLNADGKLSVLEPSATTDIFGRYLLKEIPAGSNHIVRELVFPGGTQTQPGPLGSPAAPAIGAIAFAHTSVVVLPNQTTFGIDFGNTVSEDFGDAPDSYGTSLAANGPRHGVLANFGFGAARDAEMDGFPGANALGDDLNNSDDEDGIVFVGLTPGATATALVTVNAGSNSPGKVHGWIDFDQDGVFEASERVVSNRILGSGTHSIPITIPANARLNETFARFRYGYEIDLGPKGASIAGEVEDYQVTILPSRPVANNDEFGNPPNLIRQGTTDNPLDVLANDTRTARGLPQIVESEFPKATSRGGEVRVGPVDPATGRKVLLYTPPTIFEAEAPLDDTFTYNVTDGFTTSIVPGVVTIHVSLGNPVSLDDTYTVNPAANSEPGTADTVFTLDVMDNDRFPLLDTEVISVVNVTANPMTQATINAANPQLIDFRAPSSFRGTEIFRYTISDNDPSTLDSTALVTVQVVDNGLIATETDLLAAGYLAELNITVLDDDGIVDVGQTFQIQVSSIDLRPPGGNRGVDAAYLDILVPLFVDAAGNKFPFADLVPNSIVYQSAPGNIPIYDSAQQGFFNTPAPGALDEAGGTDTSGGEGSGVVQVFTVTLRARQSTGGQAIQIVADPPEGFPTPEGSDVTVVTEGGVASQVVHHFGNNPPDAPQVFKTFFRPSGDLIIMGEGEGTWVNRSNSMDVNLDNEVTAGDALEVINHLNAWGAKSLFGSMPTGTGMIDVDMDSHLSAGDALTVINFLNARGHRAVISSVSAGAGEGEAEPQSSSGDVDDSSSAIDATLTTMLEPSTTTTSTTGNQVNPAAADNLYAGMEAAQQALKKKYKR